MCWIWRRHRQCALAKGESEIRQRTSRNDDSLCCCYGSVSGRFCLLATLKAVGSGDAKALAGKEIFVRCCEGRHHGSKKSSTGPFVSVLMQVLQSSRLVKLHVRAPAPGCGRAMEDSGAEVVTPASGTISVTTDGQTLHVANS